MRFHRLRPGIVLRCPRTEADAAVLVVGRYYFFCLALLLRCYSSCWLTHRQMLSFDARENRDDTSEPTSDGATGHALPSSSFFLRSVFTTDTTSLRKRILMRTEERRVVRRRRRTASEAVAPIHRFLLLAIPATRKGAERLAILVENWLAFVYM